MSDVRTEAPSSFRLGDAGDAVREIRARLSRLGLLEASTAPAAEDQRFDEGVDRAVRTFQQQRGLTVDGAVGPSTYRVLDEARWRLGDRLLTHVPGNLLSGDDVVALQQRLLDLGFQVGRVDGLFGQGTEQGVREFQRNIGIPPDGTCGPATLKALARLAPIVKGGQPNAMRAEERIRRAGPQLTNKIVVIDPAASTAADPELARRAAEITQDLARRVEGRLVATGVQAFLTSPGDVAAPETEADRAQFANRTDAHLSVSLHVDTSESPDAHGVSTYFYGLDAHGVRSSVGERFASLVQREIVARTDLADLRIHTKTWDFLRRTRMPAVRIDVGYITNPGDAARLADPSFRDVVAEAIVVAVQRVYLSPEADAKTGVLRLGELRAALRAQADGPV
ncbi:MAG TPA: peptidoglycan-binding protein [Nocardioidaceae bacterium]|nr:peptidoglycan-binding protein [Nocardioidaceae bacterium]